MPAGARSVTSVVCQCTRSLALRSGGGRPSRGARYSRNSMPGPTWRRRPVMRSRAPKTLFRCSCSVRSSRFRQPRAVREVAIEPQARLGVGDDDRGVIDPEEELPARRDAISASPLSGGNCRISSAMSVGVVEVERLDAAGVRVPVGQSLRTGRCVLDLVLAQPRVGVSMSRHDDRDVLEPAVVAARVDGHRPAPGGQVLGQLDRFVAQPHAHDSHAQAEHAFQALVLARRRLRCRRPSRTTAPSSRNRPTVHDRRRSCRRRSTRLTSGCDGCERARYGANRRQQRRRAQNARRTASAETSHVSCHPFRAGDRRRAARWP